MLAKRRVFTYAYVMFGFPTETEADMEMTVEVLRRSQLHSAYAFMVTPYPKTELFDLANRLRPGRMTGISYAGTDYDELPCVNLSDVSDEVLTTYMRKAYSTLFLNPFRALRIVRDFPRPWSVVRYAPGVLLSLTRSRHKYSQGQETAGMRSGNCITRSPARVSVRELNRSGFSDGAS